MQLIVTVIEIYIKMSEILNFDAYTYVKVYTSCQFGAFFTKCTTLLHIRSTVRSGHEEV